MTLAETASPCPRAKIDPLTVVSAGIVVYLLGALLHEAAHAAAVGLAPYTSISSFSSSNVILDFRGTPLGWVRFILVAGSAVDLLVGLLAAWLVVRGRGSALVRYVLVLFAVVDLSQAFGYPAAAVLFGFGDWNALVQGDAGYPGLPSAMIWRAVFVIVGVIGVVFVIRWIPRALEPFLGSDKSTRVTRATVLTALPYLVAGSLLTAMATRNPYDAVVSTAAAYFGGTAPLLFARFSINAPDPRAPSTMLTPTRSWSMIGFGILATVLNVLVFAPGIRL